MVESLGQKIINKFNELKQDRVKFDALWEEAARYIDPIHNFGEYNSQGDELATDIYDDTAVESAKLFADGLHSRLVSPSSRWFTLSAGDEALNDSHVVRMWLEYTTSIIYKRLQNSNFYGAVWEYLYIGGVYGTATMFVEYDPVTGEFVFTTTNPFDTYIAEDKFNRVDTVYRKRAMTIKQAIELFGIDALPEALKVTASTSPYQILQFIHAVYKRENYDTNSKLASKKKYASVWVLQSGENKVFKESGFDEMPYVVWRYIKASREVYGRSPGLFARNVIKSINVLGKAILSGAQFQAEPPLNVPTELAGTVSLRPRGINYYRDSNRLISPINMGSDYNMALNREARLRELIKGHFYSDYFFAINNSERQMTAQEVIEKRGEIAAVLGASIGRLNSEAFDKIIDAIFNIEFEAGNIPEPPPELLESENGILKIEYQGEIATAQRRIFTSQGITGSIQNALPLFEIFPQTLDLINEDQTTLNLLRGNGFPEKSLKDPAEVRAIRQARAEAAAKRQQVDELGQLADLGKSASIMDRNSGTTLTKDAAGALEGAL